MKKSPLPKSISNLLDAMIADAKKEQEKTAAQEAPKDGCEGCTGCDEDEHFDDADEQTAGLIDELSCVEDIEVDAVVFLLIKVFGQLGQPESSIAAHRWWLKRTLGV